VPEKLNVERAVALRYSEAARERVETLCCPVEYDPRLLRIIPEEILERDYGCGDPTRHARPGETVLDLGCGGGKGCFIAAQIVGPAGRVHGVDMNDEMLALAESHRQAIGDALGYHNVEFHKGKIQDLSPVIADATIDLVISNCVLNLVRPEDRTRMFGEVHRVLRQDGRAVISDIVCDRDVPRHMREDPTLWTGCISGAYREDLFLAAFEAAGFADVRVLRSDDEPWRTVGGIEFRSLTVEAFKGRRSRPACGCC